MSWRDDSVFGDAELFDRVFVGGPTDDWGEEEEPHTHLIIDAGLDKGRYVTACGFSFYADDIDLYFSPKGRDTTCPACQRAKTEGLVKETGLNYWVPTGTKPATPAKEEKMGRRDWNDDVDGSEEQRKMIQKRGSMAMATGVKAGVGDVVGEALTEAIDSGIEELVTKGGKDKPMWFMFIMDNPIAKALKPIVYALILRQAIAYNLLDTVIPRGWKGRLLLASEYTLMGRATYIVGRWGRPVIKLVVKQLKANGPIKNLLDTAKDIEDDE